MVLRRVEGGEVIVIRLNLGTLVNLKAHARKGLDHLIPNQGVRVKISATKRNTGEGHIDLLCLVATIQLCLSRLLFKGGQVLEHPVLQRIDFLSEVRLLLRGNALHEFHESADQAVLPVQELLPELVEGLRVLLLHRSGSLGKALLQVLKLLLVHASLLF